MSKKGLSLLKNALVPPEFIFKYATATIEFQLQKQIQIIFYPLVTCVEESIFLGGGWAEILGSEKRKIFP